MNLIDDNKCLKEINEDNGTYDVYLHRNGNSLNWRELELTADSICERVRPDRSDDGSSVFDDFDTVYTIPYQEGLHFYHINIYYSWQIGGGAPTSSNFCIRIDPEYHRSPYVIGNYGIQPGFKNPGSILYSDTVTGTYVEVEYNFYFIVLL